VEEIWFAKEAARDSERSDFLAAFLFFGERKPVLVYLNRGLIIEQAVVDLVHKYLETMKIDEIYPQNHVHATLNHPFAYLFKEQGNKAADHFPAVVISTYDDDKDRELNALRPQTQGAELRPVEYTGEDIGQILNIYEPEPVNGKKVRLPGVCAVASGESVNAIFKRLETKKCVYGYSLRAYRTDRVSVEIWAENIQVKNELYEQLRLFVLGDLRTRLAGKYQFFDPKIDDDTVRGQRSGVFNIDFGIVLAGADIQFEITYAIEQNVLDTDWDDIHREIIIGGNNNAR
jgi:hypothetical protein